MSVFGLEKRLHVLDLFGYYESDRAFSCWKSLFLWVPGPHTHQENTRIFAFDVVLGFFLKIVFLAACFFGRLLLGCDVLLCLRCVS